MLLSKPKPRLLFCAYLLPIAVMFSVLAVGFGLMELFML